MLWRPSHGLCYHHDMSENRLNEDELAEIKEIFTHYDADKNGTIERSEFANLLKALDADMSDEEVAAGLDALDDNHNGKIDFDEFLAWWGDR